MAEHRGRFQAQGGGLEESEPWNESSPLTATDAHGRLQRLRDRLGAAEREYREVAFAKAAEYIDRCAEAGGLRPNKYPVKKSFPVPAREDHRRVDLEVHAGKAFVPDAVVGV